MLEPTGDTTTARLAEAPAEAPPGVVGTAVPEAPPGLARKPGPDEVLLFGRVWPRAPFFERLFWGLGAVAGTSVLGIARWLVPDPRGIGTHEQLGLPPCGFIQVFHDVPCPSCGMTTTFALAADGRLVDGFKNQPMGFLIFLTTIVLVPILAVASIRAVSLFEATERWPWKRLVLGFIALWLLCWIYKWKVVMA
jgi:hypothetical protein